MPIDTWVAGEPGEISGLAAALTSRVPAAIDVHEDALMGPRRAYKDLWQGRAGEQVADAASDLIDDADGPVPETVTRALDEQERKVEAFVRIALDANEAISRYVHACQDLTDAVGDVVDENWLADLVLAATPGALESLGENVLNPLSERLHRSRALSSFLQGLDGDEMGDLMRHLFASVNGLDDGAIVPRLAELSEKSGGVLDRYLLVAGVLSGLQEGESLEQAIVREGGGLAAGALVTTFVTRGGPMAASAIMNYVGAGAAGGSLAGPAGTVFFGLAGLALGTGAAFFVSDQIDGWYDDREFEDLVRKGLEEQEGPG